MKNRLLHVFRNTPFGREAFLQSIYFCKKTRFHLTVYIPRQLQFLMHFSREIVTLDLDKSFFIAPKTAREHAEELLRSSKVDASYLEPKWHTGTTLPDIPIDFDFMTLPRSISDPSSRIGLGHIGPKVRTIIKNARFPVIIPAQVFKEWKSIIVFFGGSANALNAFRLGIRLQHLSGLPLKLFTYAENKPKVFYEHILENHDLLSETESGTFEWQYVEKGPFKDALYEISHNALIVAGAYGHGSIKELLFGSMVEQIQTILPNNLILVGPNYTDNPE